ncbi:hypothetical protein GOBAR_AA31835 [Gossypium barbadense]|uniref:Uncharacterized protein n=1 Tax=Gossypium barbadense TaxID=3634 RepID=A0A2P5WCP0_GOSBA|nr:hypothetical protein GOBAR_AA31835 [Gossypium barbadense]
MQLWEDVLYLTEPEQWSPNAMFQDTRIFASNLGAKKAEHFYRLVLLRCIRDDVQKNKRLHFALYQSLKKALYKPAAFNKGILFPLCKVTPEIIRELDNSCNRGEKEGDLMVFIHVVCCNVERMGQLETIEEDRFDIPDVPMEEDRLFLVFLIPLMAWYELKTAHAI